MYDLLAKGAGSIASFAGALLAAPKKVEIPAWQGIDPTKVQADTIKGNAANLPAAQALADKATMGGLESYNKMLDLALPGMRQQVNSTTASLLRGELPQDVQSSILRSGAARSLGLGVGGTGFGRNLTMRDLGLTSLQAQQQGFSQYGALASQYSPLYRSPENMGMFFTAQQRAQIGMWDAEKQWERDLMAAEVAAQPSGTNAALGNALMAAGSTLAGSGIPQGFGQAKYSGFTFGGNTGSVPGYSPGTMPFGGSATWSPKGGFGVYRNPADQSMFDAAQASYEGTNAYSSAGGY